MEKVRRVLILCKNPAYIAEVKKKYKPQKGDEEHYFFIFQYALDWLIFARDAETPPDFVVVDLEAKKCKGYLFLLKIKKIAPNATVLGVKLSQKNQP
ncbi:MAG: hypothetical protein COX29_03880 [Candidatus Moranbacteria bacterium CG23_combo_of_CG06-09_8_20_14_all_35_22]|nr:MAG: hypothetical protein COX29_03880 [Candidatus Moranbacteria bacterium CG23_combo_of_CG06-09_8_20_14_all_35_22]